MDKISDFFKELKDRVSNPLIFSFIFSWLILNWKIIISILFYKIADLQLDGYKSYIDLISKNINTYNGILYPLLIALAYTFIFPFIRNIVLAFNSWIKAWGTTLNLRMAKESSVSISKYIALRETYLKRTELLQEVIEKESNFLKENEDLKNSVLQLSSEKNTVLFDLQNCRETNNVHVLDGTWEYKNTTYSNSNITKIHINGGIVKQNNDPTVKNIKGFHFNSVGKRMSFFLCHNSKSSTIQEYHYYNMEVMDELKLLVGQEDEQSSCEFKKVY